MVLVAPPNLPPPPPAPKAPPEPGPKLPPPPNEPLIPEDGPPWVLIAGIIAATIGVVLSHWGLRTILDAIWSNPKSWFKRVVTWPARKLVSAVRQLEYKLMGEFSSRFVQIAPHIALWFRSEAITMEKLTGVIVSSNQATYKAFSYVRQTLVPTLIRQALVPVYKTLTQYAGAINKLDADLARAGSDIAATVAALPWGAPSAAFNPAIREFLGSYRRLWDKVWSNLEGRVTKLETGVRRLDDRLKPIEQWFYGVGAGTLSAIELRIGRIETQLYGALNDPATWILGLLGAAMIPALSAGGMGIALRNLTCRNTQTVAKELCGGSSNLLDDLLGGLIGLLALTQMCELLTLMFSVAGFVGDGIAAINAEVSLSPTVCGADKPGELVGYTA